MINTIKNYLFKEKSVRETFWAIISKGISVIGGIFILLFFPKTAGIEAYGEFSLFLSYIFLLGLFFASSLQNALRKEFAEGKFNNNSKLFFLEGIKLQIFIFIFSSFVLFFALNVIKIQILEENFTLFLGLLFSMHIWGIIKNTFEAVHELSYSVITYLCEYIVKILLFFIFYLFFTFGLHEMIYSFLGGYLSSLYLGFFILIKKFPKISKKEIFSLNSWVLKKILIRTFYLSLTGISFLLLTKTDIIMLSFFYTNSEVGHYALASDIAKNLTLLSEPILLGVIPLFAATKISQLLFFTTLRNIILINIFLLIFFYFGSQFLIQFLYGEKFLMTANILQVFAFFPLIAVLQNFLQQIFIIKNEVKKIFTLSLFIAFLNIPLNLLGIYIFGIYGVVLATLGSYALWFILLFLFFKKYYLNPSFSYTDSR